MPIPPPPIIDQRTIVSFVNAVESKKGFVRNPDKIFRHIASELGELDSAMYEYEKNNSAGIWIDPKKVAYSRINIGYELLDIIFLCCYMADVYGVNLEKSIAFRMEAIKKQYGVVWQRNGCPKLENSPGGGFKERGGRTVSKKRRKHG